MTRVTIPVEEALRQRVKAHPEEFGLPPGVSEARVFAKFVEVGARVLAEGRREEERSRLYAEWADDPERRQAVREATELAIEDGLL
jgi:hypothetical protein